MQSTANQNMMKLRDHHPTEKSSCKYDLKEVQARAEFEHMTSEVPVQRSTN